MKNECLLTFDSQAVQVDETPHGFESDNGGAFPGAHLAAV
jgi:hypothetical protein